jgi:hypothetical protein
METLQSLALHAGANGEFAPSVKRLARVLGTGYRRAQRAVESLVEADVIQLKYGSLATRRKFSAGRCYPHAQRWNSPPTLVIPQPLRAIELPPLRLQDWLRAEPI